MQAGFSTIPAWAADYVMTEQLTFMNPLHKLHARARMSVEVSMSNGIASQLVLKSHYSVSRSRMTP